MRALCRYYQEEPHSVPEDQALRVARMSGGNWHRPSRWTKTTICRKHAEQILATVGPNDTQVDRYGVSTLRHALGIEI